MGLFNYLRTAVLGVDLDAEQQRNDALNAQAAALNQSAYDRGVYDDATFAIAEAHRLSSDHPDISSEVSDAFNQSIQDTVSGTANVINKTAKLPFTFLWKSIPWQVWLVAAVALFLYMGGGIWLRGIINRR